MERGDVVSWKVCRIWKQLAWQAGLISVHLVRQNCISQSSLPCPCPIRVATGDILVGDLKGRSKAMVLL